MTPHQLLQTRFKLTDFLPGQHQVIQLLLEGGSALAIFPTGGGKSLCYQLPALTFEGLTLVVSPLIALMKDQIDALTALNIGAARLDSSLSRGEVQSVREGIQAGRLKLLFVAPERFNNERFMAQIRQTPIALFAIDEAHCISEWGHNFRPDYLKLAEVAKEIGAQRILALTATATPEVAADIRTAFQIPPEHAILTGFYRPNLTLQFEGVSSELRDTRLESLLLERPPGPTIVYVTLQRTAEHLAKRLQARGLPARAYHAGMKPELRSEVQENWMGSDRGIVVATIAFGMGIDKADVRYVYHHNLPKGLESYSQEIGRAGRDGKPSIVHLLACPEDVPTLENFVYGDTPTRESLEALVQAMTNQGRTFHISQYQLSHELDLRPLVLRTALTYLELRGILKQGTPFYAGYRLRPSIPPQEMASRLKGEYAQFIRQLFEAATKGRVWYRLSPDEAALELRQPRERVIRAIEYMEAQGWAEVGVSDVRHRYTLLMDGPEVAALADALHQRFQKREIREVARIQQVLALVTRGSCQTNALVGYFGEERETPCGHCTWCQTGEMVQIPAQRAYPPLSEHIEISGLMQLRQAHPKALSAPRQVARFLCGLTSPALTRARLSRHPLFGAADNRAFEVVRFWAEEVLGGEGQQA